MSSANGYWHGTTDALISGTDAFHEALAHVGRPVYVVEYQGCPAVTHGGTLICGQPLHAETSGFPLIGYVPALLPTDLGDPSFKKDLGLRYAYVVGAMANGITSVEMVTAAANNGMIGFFGAGGLSLEQVDKAIHRLQGQPKSLPFGFNLIHSPTDPELEAAVVDLYLNRGIHLISASAYLGVTASLVYYRIKGIHQRPDGGIVCPNHIVAKVSREEVARRFFAPPPEKIISELVAQHKISEQEAALGRQIPLAQDMTAEADSGGHTDNRPAIALLPTFLALRDEAAARFGFCMPLRVGLGGGIATPQATAAAFVMGAAYVLTGSINQACVEADTSETVRNMLVQAQQADVVMAPAADMFELGVKVQVLKRGTMFAMRASKLYELFRRHDDYQQIPAQERLVIERDLLRKTFDQTWDETRSYFEKRNPSQITKAEKDPKHKMALVFRSYLGQASLWAKSGDPSRQIDYQIWCGPAMGAFNVWVKGTFLEQPQQRRTAEVAMNLLYGASGLTRCHWLRSQGVVIPSQACIYQPMRINEIETKMMA